MYLPNTDSYLIWAHPGQSEAGISKKDDTSRSYAGPDSGPDGEPVSGPDGCGPDGQRDIWISIRTRINELDDELLEMVRMVQMVQMEFWVPEAYAVCKTQTYSQTGERPNTPKSDDGRDGMPC